MLVREPDLVGGLGGDGSDLILFRGMDLMKNFSNHRPLQKKG